MTVKELSELAGVSIAARQLAREDSTPSTYLASLEQEELGEDAVRFLAYKLPVREGIDWACRCVREFRDPARASEPDASLDAAEGWLKAPGDAARFAARDAADKPEATGAGRMAAYAVFFSGGTVAGPQAPTTEAPPYAAQQMVAGTVTVAVVGHDPQNMGERYRKAVAMGNAIDPAGNA